MKAVLFDLDQTLLDRSASLRAFLEEQHGRHLSHLNLQQFSERFVVLDQNGHVWKDVVYQTIVEEFQIRTMTWSQLLEDYVNNFHRNAIGYDGLIKMLTALRTAGFKLGIITNGRFPFQLQNIHALGIESFFDTILVSEKEGLRKPEVAIFERALGQLKVTAVQSIMVGDNPVADIQGAKNIGMKTIWKQNGTNETSPGADAICKNLMELPDLIATLRQAKD